LGRKIGDSLESARLFKEMRRPGNDIQALFSLELRIGTLIELDYIVIELADD
jgi:hypothetical protein